MEPKLLILVKMNFLKVWHSIYTGLLKKAIGPQMNTDKTNTVSADGS
jgi:hypothetical protein